jgi:hypothetical protein
MNIVRITLILSECVLISIKKRKYTFACIFSINTVRITLLLSEYVLIPIKKRKLGF